MIAELGNFQQNKRWDKSVMVTSYVRLPWALVHIHGAIFWNALVTMVYNEIEEDFSQPGTLFVMNIGETNLLLCQWPTQETMVTDIA